MIDPEENNRKGFFRIIALPNEELLKEFETTVRNGAGRGYVCLVWMRKEIQKRMNLGGKMIALDFEDEATKWMKTNNIEVTKERLTSLASLLAKFENQAYNVGLNADRWR